MLSSNAKGWRPWCWQYFCVGHSRVKTFDEAGLKLLKCVVGGGYSEFPGEKINTGWIASREETDSKSSQSLKLQHFAHATRGSAGELALTVYSVPCSHPHSTRSYWEGARRSLLGLQTSGFFSDVITVRYGEGTAREILRRSPVCELASKN